MTLEELKKLLKAPGNGRLFLGETPMILTTRDFIVNLQKTIEEIIGVDATRVLLYRVGARSAKFFAQKQAELFNLKGTEIMDKYFELVSVRGWGKFEKVNFDENTGEGRFIIYHSYCEDLGDVGKSSCYLWQGGLAGIVQSVLESLGKENVRIRCNEVKCVAKGDEYCEFITQPY